MVKYDARRLMEKKSIHRVVKTVYSTEELTELQRYVNQAGGRIIGTGTAEGGAISVTIEVNSDKWRDY